jgi:hypothetical protein
VEIDDNEIEIEQGYNTSDEIERESAAVEKIESEPIGSDIIETDLIEESNPSWDKGKQLDRSDLELDELPDDREEIIRTTSLCV